MLKGFLRYRMVHRFRANKARIVLDVVIRPAYG
jgi:hypothetical protein